MGSPTVGSVFDQLRQSTIFPKYAHKSTLPRQFPVKTFSQTILICVKLAKLTTTGTFTILWETGFLTELKLCSRLGWLARKPPLPDLLVPTFLFTDTRPIGVSYWEDFCLTCILEKSHLSQPPSVSVGGKCCQDFSLDPQTPSGVRRKE